MVSTSGAHAAASTASGDFCANVAHTIEEARIERQRRRLADLQEQVRARIEELKKVEASARQFVERAEAAQKAASDAVVAIYAKMSAESASTQLQGLDEPLAAAILTKLNPRVAGAILNEMDAAHASRLATVIAGRTADATN